MRRGRACAVDFIQNKNDLRDDFAGGHVAFDAELRGHTKLAADGATNLTTNANRVAVFFGNEDGFDFFAVTEVKQIPARAITRRKHIGDSRFGDAAGFVEFFAQWLGEFSDRVQIKRAARINRLIKLLAAKWFFAERLCERDQFIFGLSEQKVHAGDCSLGEKDLKFEMGD